MKNIASKPTVSDPLRERQMQHLVEIEQVRQHSNSVNVSNNFNNTTSASNHDRGNSGSDGSMISLDHRQHVQIEIDDRSFADSNRPQRQRDMEWQEHEQIHVHHHNQVVLDQGNIKHALSDNRSEHILANGKIFWSVNIHNFVFQM